MPGSFIFDSSSHRREDFFLKSFHKKALGLQERNSVGPEARHRAPSAKLEFNKKHLWRPVAVVVLAICSSVIADKLQHGSEFTALASNASQDYTPRTKDQSDSDIVFQSFLSLDRSIIDDQNDLKVLQESDNSDNQQTEQLNIPAVDYKPESLDVQPVVPENNSEAVRITGYYCERVSGYYIGDGGGYCVQTGKGYQLVPGIAACGEYWSIGTKLHVEGYGDVICLDRGGGLSPTQVDIWFPTNKDMVESGMPSSAIVIPIE